MRHPATPNDTTDSHEGIDQEGDFDLTDNTLDLPELEEALDQALSEHLSREPSRQYGSPVTPEARSPDGTLSPTTPRPERMSVPMESNAGNQTRQLGPQPITLTPEQFQLLLQPRRQIPHVRVSEPDQFTGERSKLRGFLLQLRTFFDWNGWGDTEEFRIQRIEYAKSLLREGAEKWITPFSEGRITPTWTTWAEFELALKQQFGDIDAKETARNRLEKMRQGNRTMTDHWNEFRLVSTDAEYDDATLGRLLLRGISKALQDAWANGDTDFTTTENFAQWAIRKENRLNMVRHIQGAQSTPRQQEVPRNTNGTFRQPTAQEHRSDPMDLDATNKRGFLRITREEYARRRENRLCLRCGKAGHMMRNCRIPQARIREVTVERENSEPLKEGSPQ